MTNLIKYETDNGGIELSPEIVKRYLVSGDATKITDQEIVMFMQMCKYQNLNPFLREAYLIKFGTSPATMVTGKDTFVKRAAKSKLCKGYEAGVIVEREGQLDYRKGSLILPNETLVGGWAKAYRTDWEFPLEISVGLSEYIRHNSYGKVMKNWADMPGTMIRKVALVQALREAIPEEFGGLYSPEEMPVDDSTLNNAPITLETVEEEQEILTISVKQQKRMFALAKGYNDLVKLVLQEQGWERTDQVTKELYEEVCDRILEVLSESEAEPEAIPITDAEFEEVGEDGLPWTEEE